MDGPHLKSNAHMYVQRGRSLVSNSKMRLIQKAEGGGRGVSKTNCADKLDKGSCGWVGKILCPQAMWGGSYWSEKTTHSNT